jgi:hypothetical protein
MEIENFLVNINEFEELLERATVSMASNVIFEKLLPSEIWDRAGADVTSLSSLAARLRETMLLLKPEMASTVEARFRALAQPLKDFRETLFRSSGEPSVNSKVALEFLRKSMSEGLDFLVLAKEIKIAPSEGILAVLKLREVYEAKDYLSTVAVPETVYVRFAALGRRIEDAKARLSELEHAMTALKSQLEGLQMDISSFRPSAAEGAEGAPKDKPSPEPSLVSNSEEK